MCNTSIAMLQIMQTATMPYLYQLDKSCARQLDETLS